MLTIYHLNLQLLLHFLIFNLHFSQFRAQKYKNYLNLWPFLLIYSFTFLLFIIFAPKFSYITAKSRIYYGSQEES